MIKCPLNQRFVTASAWIGIFIICVISIPQAFSQSVKVTREKLPSWVIRKEADLVTKADSGVSPGAEYYLLVDAQDNLPLKSFYKHYVIKLYNNEGVQNHSDIRIDFDPAFQKLAIHEINIYRDGEKTDEVSKHEIKTAQRESNMERFMYDGRLTAYINLDDVREGDILEYSYTLTGTNPVFQGHFSNKYYFEYSVPVGEIFFRLTVTDLDAIKILYPRGEIKPEITSTGNCKNLTWDIKNLESLPFENNVPAWYDAYKRVEISDFKSWDEVASVFNKNYKVSSNDLIKLKNASANLFKGKTTDSLIVEISRFVQDNIRYLAFESGISAYKPASPLKVIESRYGDCKAKSLLLASLLEINGIEAYPVLVNSDGIKYDSLLLPSGNIFNHVIVALNYKDKEIFIDPTISGQGGKYDNIYCPDYGYGLVLRENAGSLVKAVNNVSSEVEITNTYEVGDIGKPVTLSISTRYSGYYADDTRTSFRRSSTEEISRNYLDFYGKIFTDIKSGHPVTFTDNREENIFTVNESYVIDSAWLPSEANKNKMTFTVGAYVINSSINVTASPKREMPYLLNHPLNYREKIILMLPEEWTIKSSNLELTDPSFLFHYDSEYSDKKITLNYLCRTYKDHVSADEFRSFYEKYSDIENHLFYRLTYNTNIGKKFKIEWTAVLFFILLSAAGSFIGTRIYKYYNVPTNLQTNRELGGWLVLVAIGLFITTIRVIVDFFFTGNYFDHKTWALVLDQGNGKGFAFAILIIMEFIYNSLLLVYLVFTLILFFKRRNCVPRLMVTLYVATMVLTGLDTMAAFTLMPDLYDDAQKQKAVYEMIRVVAVAMVWGTYFLLSQRVRETFTVPAPSKPGSTEITVPGEIK
ncbi:MAG: DUF3857 domain-containing protein [Bacteroidales bacterium]